MLRRCARGNALRVALRTGVALGAVMAAAVSVQAADLPIFKGQAPVRGEFRAFIEGGRSGPAATAFPISAAVCLETEVSHRHSYRRCFDRSVHPKVGWTVALGFDYRYPGTPWHINGQFRYGQARKDSFGTSISFFSGKGPDDSQEFSPNSFTEAKPAMTTGTADFGAGYDTGPSTMVAARRPGSARSRPSTW